MKKSQKNTPVWKQKNPKKKNGTSVKLTASEKAEARERAAKAGRRYPNLIDNMYVAKKKKKENSK